LSSHELAARGLGLWKRAHKVWWFKRAVNSLPNANDRASTSPSLTVILWWMNKFEPSDQSMEIFRKENQFWDLKHVIRINIVETVQFDRSTKTIASPSHLTVMNGLTDSLHQEVYELTTENPDSFLEKIVTRVWLGRWRPTWCGLLLPCLYGCMCGAERLITQCHVTLDFFSCQALMQYDRWIELLA
jgi:hypothetical protein